MNDAVKTAIAESIGAAVHRVRSVGGGDINEAWRVETAGAAFFVKTHVRAPDDMFAREAEGLDTLRAAGALRVPRVVGEGTVGRTDYLVLEWIDSGSSGRRLAERFGEGLAQLHRTGRPRFGHTHDNFIGSLPQSNREHDRWLDFFRQERLEAQLRLARQHDALPDSTLQRADRLLAKLDTLIPAGSAPSLLHGDLWGGNYMIDAEGAPVLIDPAVYWGDREIELAFTELFGGFPSGFHDAYQASWPLDPGYRERRDLYNLYPLLVHTNLFGGHYAARVDRVIRQYL